MKEKDKSEFLKAQWKYLTLFNFAVPDECLQPYLPRDCVLDKFEGSAFVSLVYFQFLKTKVFGVPWPGFTNFPEMNLRFYIRHRGQRGVCFVREYVPSALVAWLARTMYKEPYKAATMSDQVTVTPAEIKVQYSLKCNQGNVLINLSAQNKSSMPSESSMEHFFKEHELGVGRDHKRPESQTLTYNVYHPQWHVYPVTSSHLSIDWEKIYGPQFAFLQGQKPHSIVFAEGSDIVVYWQD